MSYGGTYGADETCVHDVWRPNCWRCNGRPAQFVRDYDECVRHVQALPPTAGVTARLVYDATCPECTWRAIGQPTVEDAQAAYRVHVEASAVILNGLTAADDMWAEVEAQGLPVTRLSGQVPDVLGKRTSTGRL